MKKYHYLRKAGNPLKRHRKKANLDKYYPNFIFGEKIINNENVDNNNEINNRSKQKDSKSNINIYNEPQDAKIFSSSINEMDNKDLKQIFLIRKIY